MKKLDDNDDKYIKRHLATNHQDMNLGSCINALYPNG